MSEPLDPTNPAHQPALLEREKAVLRIKAEAKRAIKAEEHGATALPESLTVAELLERPDVDLVWRIKELQCVGHRVLLAASAKAGKTTLAVNVMRSILDGDLFLGIYPATVIDGCVGVLDFEMSPNQLKRWYRAARIANDQRIHLFPMRGEASTFNIIDPKVRTEWADRLRSRNIKYLIVDCLRPVLDALTLNEHTEAGLFLTALDALLTEAGISEALLIHHMGHQGDRARGDSRLIDWPDVGWKLSRPKAGKDDEEDPGAPREFSAYGRDVEVAKTIVDFDKDTLRVSVGEGGVGVSRAAVQKSAALIAVVQVIEANPGINQNKLVAAVTGYKKKQVIDAATEGVDRGLLIREPGPNRSLVYRVATEAVEPGLLDSVMHSVGAK